MTKEEFDTRCDEAEGKMESGDPKGAARILTFAAWASGLERDDHRLVRLARLIQAIGQALQIDTMRDSAAALTSSFDSNALFQLGYELVELELPGIAVPFLRRLDLSAPGTPAVVNELASALERAGRHEQARDLLLRNEAMLNEFWPCYLLCFNAISAADLGTAKTYITGLAPTNPAEETAALRLGHMLDRVANVSSDLALNDLRGWHYVMNASLLLHLSPYGFDDGMNGRYAYTTDSASSVRRELERLVLVLQTQGMPRKLLSLQDRGSQVIAHALKTMTGLPVEPFSGQADGLVVAYDLDRVSGSELEAIVRPPTDASAKRWADKLKALAGRNVEPRSVAGQRRLFARAACWTPPPPCVPDYVGLMHQYIVAPWDERRSFGAEGEAATIPESQEPVTELARQITSATIEDDVHEPNFEDPIDPVLHLARQLETPSDRWFDGPVRSSRFL